MTAVESIADADALLRRVPNNPQHWERAIDGSLRVSSAVFARSKEDAGVSVDVRRLLDDPGQPELALSDRVEHGLIEFTAARVRRQGLDVEHAPVPGNYAHANIIDFPESKKERKRVRLELAKGPYAWVRHPAGAD